MAAIPGAGGAWHALPGMIRVLLRVAVLGGLLVAAWLLGAGLGHAEEDPGPPPAGLIGLVAGSAGGTPHGELALPDTVGSAVAAVSSTPLAAASTAPHAALPRRPALAALPLRPAPAVGKLDVLRPLLTELSRPASRLVAPAVLPRLPVPTSVVAAPAPARASPVAKPVVVAPGPAAEYLAPLVAVATQPLPSGVRCTPADPGSAVPVPVAALAQRGLPEPSTLPVAEPASPGPVSPGPASPPSSPSVACPAAAPGSASNAKAGPGVVTGGIAAVILAGWMQRVRLRSAAELPRSPATQPPISPD